MYLKKINAKILFLTLGSFLLMTIFVKNITSAFEKREYQLLYYGKINSTDISNWHIAFENNILSNHLSKGLLYQLPFPNYS